MFEYDICEMAFTTYVCARAYNKPFTAVPVFVTRNFHHWAIFYNEKSGIRKPKDLEGRKVGVNRGYTVTTGLWARGILQTEYGVDLTRSPGCRPTTSTSRNSRRRPMSITGIAASRCANSCCRARWTRRLARSAWMRRRSSHSFPTPVNAAFDYFRRTGIYPINHGLVVKNTLLKEMPWIAGELVRMFEAAKAIYLKDLQGNAGLSSWDKAAADNAAVVGDPFPFGIERNRKALEAITQFAVDQHMVPRKFAVDELFAPVD